MREFGVKYAKFPHPAHHLLHSIKAEARFNTKSDYFNHRNEPRDHAITRDYKKRFHIASEDSFFIWSSQQRSC